MDGSLRLPQTGQVVLITLLVLTIATTVALSLISRTTTDVTITAQTEESSRAFSAAEAGVEEALVTGVGTTTAQVLSPGVSYNVTVNSIGGVAGIYEFPKKTLNNTTETVWLVDHNSDGTLNEADPGRYRAPTIDICWSDESPKAAVVATVLYKETSDGSYRILKAAFDSDSARAVTNKFTTTVGSSGCAGTTGTSFRETINFAALNASVDPATDILLALRIRPVYNDAKFAIDSAGITLPLQGKRIESTGTTESGVNRKIVVYQQFRSPATLFDAAIYSQGSFSH